MPASGECCDLFEQTRIENGPAEIRVRFAFHRKLVLDDVIPHLESTDPQGDFWTHVELIDDTACTLAIIGHDVHGNLIHIRDQASPLGMCRKKEIYSPSSHGRFSRPAKT